MQDRTVVMQYKYAPVMYPLWVGVGGLLCCVLAQMYVERSLTLKSRHTDHSKTDKGDKGKGQAKVDKTGERYVTLILKRLACRSLGGRGAIGL